MQPLYYILYKTKLCNKVKILKHLYHTIQMKYYETNYHINLLEWRFKQEFEPQSDFDHLEDSNHVFYLFRILSVLRTILIYKWQTITDSTFIWQWNNNVGDEMKSKNVIIVLELSPGATPKLLITAILFKKGFSSQEIRHYLIVSYKSLSFLPKYLKIIFIFVKRSYYGIFSLH